LSDGAKIYVLRCRLKLETEMSSFCNLSLLVTPLISLRTLISAACTLGLLVVADVSLHVSQPTSGWGRRTLLYIITLADIGTYLSLMKCVVE